MAISQTDLNKIYLAYFGRPVDASGLTTFSKMEIGNVIGAFNSSKESQDLYGTDPVAKINAIYKNLFGREAEPEGLKGWLDRLATGEVTPASAALEILNRAQNSDAKAIENKIAAADAFTTELLKNTGSMVGYSGNDAAKVARDWLAKVNAESKIDQVVKGVNAAVVAVSSAGGTSVTGNTFTLTDKIGESVVGTAGNDTFKAVLGSAAGESTLNIGDIIDGGAGTDTLNLIFTGTYAPTAAEIKNVEIVNLNVTAQAAGTDYLKSSLYTGVQQLWQVANGSEVVSVAVATGSSAAAESAIKAAEVYKGVVVADGVTAGFKGNGTTTADAVRLATGFSHDGGGSATATVTATAWDAVEVKAASAAQKTISIALDGVGTGSKLDVVAAASGKIETVNVSGSLAKASSTTDGTLTVDLDGANTKTFNGAFTSGVKLSLSSTTAVETIDLSKSTGGVELNAATGFDKLATLKGGAGNDKLAINLVDVALTVDAGAGNDVLKISDAGSADTTKGGTITLGAGKDTLQVAALLNVVDTADLSKGLVTVTDFKIGEDTLQLGASVGKVLTTAQLDTAKAADSLKAAVETLLAGDNKVANGNAAVFNWGDDAYVFVNNATATTNAFEAGDGLIKLVGVDAAALSTDQNGGLLFATIS